MGIFAKEPQSGGACIVCNLLRCMKWSSLNKEHHNAFQREWARKNRNPEKRREYRLKNRTRLNEENREYRKRRKGKVFPSQTASRQRERRLADPDFNRKHWAKCKLWRSKNPEKRRASIVRRRAKERNAGGSHTAQDIKWILRAQRGKCAYCREKFGDKYHVDHIVALSKGGSNDRSNIQLTCKSCNLRKHAKDPIDYAQSIGMLI